MKVLFLCSASHRDSDRNMNHFQRVYFLSRALDLTILGCKGAEFNASASDKARILRAPWNGKGGLLLYAVFLALQGVFREYDVVLTEPSVLGFAGWIARAAGGCRWAVDIWDIPIRAFTPGGRLTRIRCDIVRWAIKRAYRSADRFIVSILPDFELKNFDLPQAKMRLFRNAIWLDGRPVPGEPQADGQFRILCMRSEYHRHMGLDVLAKAFLILREHADAKLVCVGRIPESIRHQVEPLVGREDVEFHDFLPYRLLQAKIRAASVCVIPFRNVADLAQTYPIKVLEYFAMGKPVVASGIAGISSLVRDGWNGLLYRNDDPEELADKIRMLYENEPLRRELSWNAAALEPSFDCRVKNRRIVEELESLAGKAHP
jgi:glycosyltransferase involved in cell wall biosynthesis